jgi:mannose-1-phosphate guanylyltransferase
MAIQTRRENLWAILLAAGEGTRLSTLTRSLHGWDMPKQFATLWGGRSFLARTVDRITALVPRQRTIVVVAEDCKALTETQLRDYPGIKIVYQPENRGTGAGVLLPLAHVLAQDPGANILLFPSDHHVEREGPFRDAIHRAVLATDFAPSRTVLIGAEAERAATDLGWIHYSSGRGPLTIRGWGVKAFVEKPDAATALELHRQGALWNTMIIASQGQALWALADLHIPEVVSCFMTYRALIGHRGAGNFLGDIYTKLPVTDFSRDILQHAKGLAVTPMIDAGWTDCGTPESLFRAMEPSHERARLLARIERQAPLLGGGQAAAWRTPEMRRGN